MIGFIGLGKMGVNMVTRLAQNNYPVIGFAPHAESVKKAEQKGAKGAHSLEELIEQLPSPKTVWLMVSAGKATEETISKLASLLEKGDIVIDGGNSFYQDSIKRAKELPSKEFIS